MSADYCCIAAGAMAATIFLGLLVATVLNVLSYRRPDEPKD